MAFGVGGLGFCGIGGSKSKVFEGSSVSTSRLSRAVLRIYLFQGAE